MFIDKVLINNGYLFNKGGCQICSTSIAKSLNVSSQTVTNWLKSLQKLNLLQCVDPFWKQGFKAKKYSVSCDLLKDLINKFNGYTEKYFEQIEKSKAKNRIREEVLESVSSITTNYSDMCKVAQCYLGCPRQYLKDISKHFRRGVLSSPSVSYPSKTKAWEAINAYDFVNKKNGFDKMDVEYEEWFLNKYGEDFSLDDLKIHSLYLSQLYDYVDVMPIGHHLRKQANQTIKLVMGMVRWKKSKKRLSD
jgi:hypothetical protein